jgi:hypothetical protein
MAAQDPENTLIMQTTKGKVVIALRPDLAPNHVARIKQLAREIEGMEHIDKLQRGEPVPKPDRITSLKVAADEA